MSDGPGLLAEYEQRRCDQGGPASSGPSRIYAARSLQPLSRCPRLPHSFWPSAFDHARGRAERGGGL